MNDVQVTRVVVALCEHTFFGVSVKCYNISMYVLNTSFGLNAMLHTCSFSLWFVDATFIFLYMGAAPFS